MAEPPTALEAREAVVREWDVGFCGFRGGALPDGDRGQGVTVGMGDGGGGLQPCGGRKTATPGVLSPQGSCLPVSVSACLYLLIMKIKM